MLRRAALATLLGLLAPVTVAHAQTQQASGSAAVTERVLSVVLSEGADVLSIDYDSPSGFYLIRYAAGTVTLGPGCSAFAAAGGVKARCAASGIDAVVIEGRGGNDGIRIDPVATGDSGRLDGGDGTDNVTATAAVVALGGPGDDSLIAQVGRAEGGPGDDTFSAQARPSAGAAEMVGGPGFDKVDYFFRTEAVTVTLDDQPNDGAEGEKANVHSDVEDVFGTAYDDRLTGSAASNRLQGERGNDIITGGGDADFLFGGPGDDTFFARDGIAERIGCDEDLDTANADVNDFLFECETERRTADAVPDADGDGTRKPADCDDTRADVRPGAPDAPDNGIDEDCDGKDAENLDRDGDGSSRPQDCDDRNPAIRPNASDVPDDGIDQDCSGGDAVDLDRDRDGSPRPQDCDDRNPAVNPDVEDIPGNAVDEDCDQVKAKLPVPSAALLFLSLAYDRYTTFTSLRLVRLRPGQTATVTCRGRGCPYPSRRFAIKKRGRLDLLKAFRGRPLAPGARLEVAIIGTNKVTKIYVFAFLRGAAPLHTLRCTAPSDGQRRRC